MSEDIQANLERVREVIAAACARANRSPDAVTLVAVSKRKTVDDILAAHAAGVQHFGENRVEEMEAKHPQVMERVHSAITWHMIGPVQSRKARYIPRLFDMLEAVDTVKIAEKLSQLITAGELPALPVLVQVNVSGEATKSGLSAQGWQQDDAIQRQIIEQMRQISALPGLDVRGLMTMAPHFDDAEATRPVFISLRNLRDALTSALDAPLPELSMGMTNDYPVAIEEGATIVRVGRAIFGERVY